MLEDMAFDAVYTDTFSEEYDGEAQNPFSPFSSPGIMAP